MKKRAVKQSSFYINYICIYKPIGQIELLTAFYSTRPSRKQALHKTNADTF